MALRIAFRDKYFEFRDTLAPVEHYMEQCTDHMEQGEFRAEPLTQVVSRDEVDFSDVGASVARDGAIRIRKGYSEVALPETMVEMRRRLRIWGHRWILMALKHPNRQQLQDAVPQVFTDYIDYLEGPDVIEFVAKNDSGAIISRPSFSQVRHYDYYIRKKMAEHMNVGVSVAKALKLSYEDTSLRERQFSTPVGMAAVPRGRLRSRSPRRDRQPWQPKGRGKGKGKGKGKGDRDKDNSQGLLSTTSDGRPICYKYNNQWEKCKGRCNYIHVCRRCEGRHPMHMCDNSGAGGRAAGGAARDNPR